MAYYYGGCLVNFFKAKSLLGNLWGITQKGIVIQK